MRTPKESDMDPDPTYPRRYLCDPTGRHLAVSPGLAQFSAYQHLPEIGVDAMRERAETLGGYVMQKDDPYLSPFTLYDFTR